MILSAKDILEQDDLETITVDVPKWKGSVIVREMRGEERDAWEQTLISKKTGNRIANVDNLRASLLVRCLVNEANEPLFKLSDIKALGQKSAGVLSDLFDVAAKLNGIGRTEQDELVAEKN